MQLHDVQPKVQVTSETLRLDIVLQIAVRRGDESLQAKSAIDSHPPPMARTRYELAV
jgi:hypothetical protein